MAAVEPILTPRLRLRPYREDDREALWQLWTDAAVREFLWDNRVIGRDEAAAAMHDSMASTTEHGFGHWAVERRDAPGLIGFCGLRFLDAPPEVELMYGLAPAHWRQGFASEASLAWLRRGFTQHGLARIWAQTDVGNLRSAAVMRRLGMRFSAHLLHHGLDTLRYVLTREAFLAAPPASGAGEG